MNARDDARVDKTTEQLIDAFFVLRTRQEIESFLLDLLTPHEMRELSQRLDVAQLLDQGVSYVGVSEQTGASSTTVSRVSKCLNGNVGGYRLALEQLARRATE